jgi:hypothetical protein
MRRGDPDSGRDGQTRNNPSATKAGFTNGWMGLIGEIRVPRPEGFAGEVAKSRWLRIQSVNHVFPLTLTQDPLIHQYKLIGSHSGFYRTDQGTPCFVFCDVAPSPNLFSFFNEMLIRI